MLLEERLDLFPGPFVTDGISPATDLERVWAQGTSQEASHLGTVPARVQGRLDKRVKLELVAPIFCIRRQRLSCGEKRNKKNFRISKRKSGELYLEAKLSELRDLKFLRDFGVNLLSYRQIDHIFSVQLAVRRCSIRVRRSLRIVRKLEGTGKDSQRAVCHSFFQQPMRKHYRSPMDRRIWFSRARLILWTFGQHICAPVFKGGTRSVECYKVANSQVKGIEGTRGTKTGENRCRNG